MRVAIWSALAALGLAIAHPADPQQMEQGGVDPNAKAAYFVLGTSGYVFALNVAENGDVYYHMNAPASHAWMGVGFGSSMTNVRMIVSYLGENGHNLTNSCRMSYGHSEPVHDPDCQIDNVSHDGYAPFANTLSPDGVMISHAVCRNCSTWKGGKLDLYDIEQPFIFALGPNKTLRTDDLAADLRMHQIHGVFNMDMTVATNYTGSYGRVPAPQDPGLAVGHSFWAFANYYSSTDYNAGSDTDWAPLAHGVIMCLAFVLIFPVGALSLRLLKRVAFHAMAQVVGLFFFLAGFALAIYASKMYNKSKNFNTAHQVIGLIIFAAILVQIGLGLLHHVMYLRTKGPSFMGTIHRFLGLGIMVLGLANAGLGFDFAGNSHSNLPYGIVVALMGLVFGALFVLVIYYNSRNVYRPEKEHILSAHYGKDVPAEYEMHEAPFATMGHVQTPRTPFFATAKWDDDPENYRAHFAQNRSHTETSSGWGETPAEERAEDLFPPKGTGISLR